MDVDGAYLIRMREALREFVESSGTIGQQREGKPEQSSQAAIEVANSVLPDSIGTAWSLSAMLIEHSGQHVSAFVKILTEPVEVLACWTCVRSMLESSALAAWLLDPSIDAAERIGRVYAHRYQGIQQEQRLARATGVQQTDIDAYEHRLDQLEQVVLQLGYPPVRDRQGRRSGLCQQMPSTTDMIENVLGEGWMYRLLSAVAHGHNWAVRQLGFEVAGQKMMLEGVEVTPFTPAINPSGMALLGVCSMTTLARPLWNQCRYFGWDALQLEELFETIADKLSINVSKRFWRS